MFLFSASFWLTVLAVITVLFAYLASTNPFFIRSLYCDSLGHPMPKGWVPFFGHLFVLDLRRFNDSSWALIKDLPKTTGAVTMWLFGQPFLIPVTAAAGKDAVKRLEHVKDPAVYKPVEGVFGRNIVTMNGRSWARLRRIISPAFRPNWLKRLVPWAKSSSEVFIGRMEKIAEENEGVVKVDDELMQMTLSIIAASAFGNNLGYSVDSTKLSSPVATAFNELMELAQQLFENPWLLTMSSSARQTLKRNRELLDGILRDALAEVRAGDKVDVDADVSKGERATIMQVLAHAHDAETGEGLTDEEIMSNALVMLLAGTDTTAHTLSFTLHALASDADLQDAVHAECSRLLAGRDFLDMSELSQLELTTRVIMETLRLFPLAIGTSRILPTGAQLGPTVLKEKVSVAAALRLSSVPHVNQPPTTDACLRLAACAASGYGAVGRRCQRVQA
eukprot:PLAT12293.1.p1 GENE.PLAT12293.1~~PLAT12293.1.p1  ORF type:complete len:448 (+),score=161.97 PLAT12293.1:59-1402(+)